MSSTNSKMLVRTSLEDAGTTIFNINFDFASSTEQTEILRELQARGYSLFGYKGASGPTQIEAGIPTWFKYPYAEVFGEMDIDYEPLYKVYAFNKAKVGAYTVIKMNSVSNIPFPLGTKVQFNPDGTFSRVGSARKGTIELVNSRPAGTSDITVGLAAKVEGDFAPFCAFTSTPQSAISMEPKETVVLFAAQTNIQSGSVVANAAAPGCTFEFNSSRIRYDLKMIPSTFGITNTPDGHPVTETEASANLRKLLS